MGSPLNNNVPEGRSVQLIVCAVKYQIMGYHFHFSSFLGEKHFKLT